MLYCLLEFMSDPSHRGQVIFLAATNRPDLMDAALRRAVSVELEDTNRAIRELTDEVTRLRKSNENLVAKLARLAKG